MLTSARRRAAGPRLRRHQRRRRRHRHLRCRHRHRHRRRLRPSARTSDSTRARVMLRITSALATSPPKILAVVATNHQPDTAPLIFRGRTEKTVKLTVDNSFALTLDCAPWATDWDGDGPQESRRGSWGREQERDLHGRRLHDCPLFLWGCRVGMSILPLPQGESGDG